jgi:membrane fusion protein, multidrug efflux system
LLAACDSGPPAAAPDIRPVRVVTVERAAEGEVVSLTGTVQAETEVNLAFRIDGRMVERLVNVGDRCAPGRSSRGSTATMRRTTSAPPARSSPPPPRS